LQEFHDSRISPQHSMAGFAQNTDTLIVFRIMQGLGGGGLAALSQITMADIISPRERGRYAGLFGAVMAIGGPLLGGVVTDAVGWRWNFFIALPVAIVAIILLQVTLHLPERFQRVVSIDYLGIVLISAGVSLLLIWVTLAGNSFEWASLPSFAMVLGAAILLLIAVIVEFKAKEPIIPLDLFKNRTVTLAVIASLSVGVAMFGTSVFLSQYTQLARGATPTESGLLTIPMMGGLLISSTFFGNLISRTGKWKAIMLSGSVLVLAGSLLLGSLRYATILAFVGVFMFILGAGVGMIMQNLVLVVQNTVEITRLGVATSTVTFFRRLGGTVGVAVMGSVLGTVVAQYIRDGTVALSPANQAVAAETLGDGTIPQVSLLPAALRVVVESAYGMGAGNVFLLMVPLAVITLVTIALLPNIPLGTMTGIDRERSAAAGQAAAPATGRILIDVSTASVALPPSEPESGQGKIRS
jgi:MFS family permease